MGLTLAQRLSLAARLNGPKSATKTQWEYDLVERPFCEQLQAMGCQWIEGDTEAPKSTEKSGFREALPDWRERQRELLQAAGDRAF